MSENNALVKADVQAIKTGGQGLNPRSRLLQLKPATLSINQRMTQAKGAIPGKLRINETGQQFDEMIVSFLDTPIEQRAWYEGDDKNKDTLMCFSTDLITPHKDAKVPQAYKCEGCPKADWSKWRQNKIPANIPPCETYYKAWLIDTQFQFPLVMYIRATQKKPFEAGLQNLARTLAIMRGKGCDPNIWDVKFKLSVDEQTNAKKQVFYNLVMSDFSATTEEERNNFGAFYAQLSAARQRALTEKDEAESAAQVAENNAAIDSTIMQDTPASAPTYVDGEYVTSDAPVITI